MNEEVKQSESVETIEAIVNNKQKYHRFCKEFRKEINGSKLADVLHGLVDSASSKVPLKKAYIQRACKNQKPFLQRVNDAFAVLCKSYPRQASALLALRDELTRQ